MKLNPGKFKISAERKSKIKEILETLLWDIATDNHKEPKFDSNVSEQLREQVIDIYDVVHELEGIDYLRKCLDKMDNERLNEYLKLEKKIAKQ